MKIQLGFWISGQYQCPNTPMCTKDRSQGGGGGDETHLFLPNEYV